MGNSTPPTSRCRRQSGLCASPIYLRIEPRSSASERSRLSREELGVARTYGEHDGLPARGFGVFIDGRLALYYSFQSDLGDGWEDASVHGDPATVREEALRMGVNLFVYVISSGGAG